jgi:2'-5' RNA ligase
VQINLPSGLAREIMQWGDDNIPDESVFHNPDDPSFGREDEIHVTALYGIHSESPEDVREVVCRTKTFDVQLKKLSIFTNDDFDVLKIGVESEGLVSLNERLRHAVEYTSKFKTYVPHVTIAYLKKGKAWKYEGVDRFDGRMFHADSVVFSPKQKNKVKISMMKS